MIGPETVANLRALVENLFALFFVTVHGREIKYAEIDKQTKREVLKELREMKKGRKVVVSNVAECTEQSVKAQLHSAIVYLSAAINEKKLFDSQFNIYVELARLGGIGSANPNEMGMLLPRMDESDLTGK